MFVLGLGSSLWDAPKIREEVSWFRVVKVTNSCKSLFLLEKGSTETRLLLFPWLGLRSGPYSRHVNTLSPFLRPTGQSLYQTGIERGCTNGVRALPDYL